MQATLSGTISRQTEREKRRRLRRETTAWQRGAVGLLALSITANVTLFAAYYNSTRTLKDMVAQEREARLQAVHQMRLAEEEKQDALNELAKMVIAVEAEERNIASEEVSSDTADTMTDLHCIGECTITHYCCEQYDHICGNGDGLTASGLPLEPGMCAVDPDVIPLGSTVIVDGVEYLATDTGALVKGNHIDIAVESHTTALDMGVYTTEVFWYANK